MILYEKQIYKLRLDHKHGCRELTSDEIFALLNAAEHYRAEAERLAEELAKLRQGNLF